MSLGVYRENPSRLHGFPAEVKILCALGVVLAVVWTPREMLWPYAFYAVALVCVWRFAGIPIRWIVPRMVIELPFVVLAVLLPFAEGGVRVDVLGMSLSTHGLWAAWGILAKGTLGVAVSLTLAATTRSSELPTGLARLHVPPFVTTVVLLMLRYVELLAAEFDRMRTARIARGDSPRALHQVGATARGVGGLFLRSYERGERVHLAMASRGFDGTVPKMDGIAGVRPPATMRDWAAGMLVVAVAVGVASTAWVLR